MSGAPLVLAVSGSLRRASSNTALLRVAGALAPEHVRVRLYTELGKLPPFNPDLEGREPGEVLAWRALLAECGGVLFSTPEYAHGVPGALKNALDWVVGSGELVGKPVALLCASPRAVYAQAALTETLRVMSARLIEAASVTVPLASNAVSEAALRSDPAVAVPLRSALAAFAQSVQRARTSDV